MKIKWMKSSYIVYSFDFEIKIDYELKICNSWYDYYMISEMRLFLVPKYIYFENNKRFCFYEKFVFISVADSKVLGCSKYSSGFNAIGISLKIWNMISFMR